MQVSRILRRSLDRLRSYLNTPGVADGQRELALQRRDPSARIG
jgi:hypothetical protein